MTTPIEKQGPYLIATVQSALHDGDLADLHDTVICRLDEDGADAVIVDVAGLDVLDSFAARTFRTLTRDAGRRGARTMVVGLQPGVATAMARIGLTLDGTLVAANVEAGLRLLGRQ